MKTPKTKWLLLAAAAVTLFLWTARESFEDTASVQGPPYGNTAASATRLIAIMSPSMLTSIKKQVGVTSETLSDAEKIKIVYGSGTNSSPVAQVMSSFYWQVYKPATSTITLAQLNKFFETYDETWVKANIPDVREFLKRYFIQGQNGAAQSGYLDALNTVWGQMAIRAAAPKPEEKKEADKPAPVDNTLMYVAIGISATALFAVLITLLLPARNVL
jgi:hypothetical protein